MNYQVIVFLDEVRNKSYYHSYVVSNDTTLGNMSCVELPPYQDYNKAQACYWDMENSTWIYDAEKYEEIIVAQETAQNEAEYAAAVQAATPTNLELMEAIMEIAQGQSDLEEDVTKLKAMIADGGDA